MSTAFLSRRHKYAFSRHIQACNLTLINGGGPQSEYLSCARESINLANIPAAKIFGQRPHGFIDQIPTALDRRTLQSPHSVLPRRHDDDISDEAFRFDEKQLFSA
jgi:hypothetical protein